MANFDTKNKEIEEMIGGFYSFTKYHDSFKDQTPSFARRSSDPKRSVRKKIISKKLRMKRQIDEILFQQAEEQEKI